MSLQRPNTCTVQRLVPGGTSNAGDLLPATPSTVVSGLPCMISAQSMTLGAQLQSGPIAPTMQMHYTLLVDGVPAGGAAPGSSITFNGLPYIVAANGKSAFPDIRADDRITREDGAEFLVVGPPVLYPDVCPTLQVHLVYGKAWG